jgi:hypothetical protein
MEKEAAEEFMTMFADPRAKGALRVSFGMIAREKDLENGVKRVVVKFRRKTSKKLLYDDTTRFVLRIGQMGRATIVAIDDRIFKVKKRVKLDPRGRYGDNKPKSPFAQSDYEGIYKFDLVDIQLDEEHLEAILSATNKYL